MRIRKRAARWLLAAVVAALAGSSGCGSGDDLPRQAISGTVTLDGQPLDKGLIQFFPAAEMENALAAGAMIEGGSYSIPQSEGLVPGNYKVMISSEGGDMKAAPGESTEAGAMPGLGPLHPPDRIPAKYNSATTLTANVTAEGPNEFKFDLKSK